VAARFRALRHEDVGSDVERMPSLGDGVDLHDERNSCVTDEVGERRGIAERQHDRGRALGDNPFDDRPVDRPRQ
jgi:hypothetical protein